MNKILSPIGKTAFYFTNLVVLFLFCSFQLKATTPPTVTKVPNHATICASSVISVTLGGLPTGGSCTCNYEQQRMNPGSSTWVSMTPGSSYTLSTQAGTAKIRARIVCTGGTECTTSDWTEVTWVVVSQPSIPTLSISPSSTVCVGSSLTATASNSSGGTGSCYYIYATQLNNPTFDTVTWSTNNQFIATNAGSLYARARYYCDGYGCDTSTVSSAKTWNIINDPLPASLVKNPNTNQICVGGSVTVTTSTGSGGAGTCTDYYRYSNDGGSSWSSRSTSRPEVSAVNQGEIIYIQAWRECTGPGCETSDTTTVSWTSIADPVWNTITISHDSTCVGGGVTINGNFTGGIGGFSRWYRSTTAGSGGTQINVYPDTVNTSGTYYYYAKYFADPTNSGCNVDISSSVKLVVVKDPTWTGITLSPSSLCLGGEVNFSASTNGGLGGSINWIRADLPSGSGITVSSPDIPAAVDTFYYRPKFTPSPNAIGCNINDGTQYTVYVKNEPIAKTIVGTPISGSSLCIGANISASFSGGVNSSGTEVDFYEYSINGGSSWNNYTPSSTITTTTAGSDIVQIRTRKVSPDGTCISEWNIAKWTVVASPIAPSLNTKTPNINYVCAGINVNASINAGSGGIGCSDILEYSTNNGGTWNTYVSAQNISSTGATTIIIRAARGNCQAGSYCNTTDYTNIATWEVTSVSAGTMTPNPAGGVVCIGFPVSASVLTSGSGGNCSDEYQYRYQASGIWTSWFSYTPGSNISSTGRTAIEIKVIRNCESGSGCFAENIYSWNVSSFTVTSPTMTKIPNLAGVCQGTDVSASIATAGSGGSGCSDNYEYRTNTGSWNSWQTYVPGTTIPTGGVQNIEVRAWRGLCDIGGLCGDSTINVYSWIIQSQPMPPTIDRNPIAINICQSDTVHPTIVSTIGGIGCTNYSQYRLLTGGSWSAWYNYSSGQNILANGRQSVQIRAWKGNCTTGTGCSTSDTIIETWNVTPNITNPSITKIPNRTSVCEEEEVAAALFNPSSGGIGCEDIFEYRLFNGIDWSTWSPYTIGNTISPLGSEIVEIRAYRGNCDPGGNCNNPSPNVISWTVIPSAIPPIITKNPAQNEVCAGTSVSGTITSGSGGISCFDYRQYRFFNGTDWSPWYTYISGSNITTNTPRTKIQVRAFRGCQPTTGCISSDTSMAEWDIIQGVVHPIMTKTPDLSSVCQGATLSANINTSGSGGLGCEDIYEIRLNGGSWQMYIPADPIITDNTVTSVDIRSTRTNCTSGLLCGSPDGNIYSWTVLPQPVAPTLNKIPNEDYVCSGQNVSVNVVAGSGFSCSDYFQYRRYNPSTSLWTNWSFYPTGFQIPTSGYTQVEVRGYNFNCNSQTACNPDTNLVSWNIIPNVIAPTLTKTPNVNTVCQGSAVSATIIPGSGGDACSDISEYSVDNGLTWQMYLSGDFINTIGLTNITIRTYRSNCNPLYNCPTSDTNSVQWTVVGLPTSPIITRIPDEDVICQGSSVSASITAGTGGASCNDIYQYRYHTSSGWSTWITYPNNYNISTSSGRTDIVIRAYRSCTGSGCGTSDTSLVSWSIDPSIVNPSIVKTPNNAQVCEGTLLSANIGTAGSGGNGCEDIMEFSADNGLNWSIYIPNDDIQTVGFTKIIVRAYRGNCVGGGACTPTDTNQVTWLIVPAPTNPIIVKNPNLSEICHGNSISATITNGTSGISCSNFSQYRIKSGTTWSAWYNYTSGNNILYPSNANNVEVRAFRGNCGNGCSSSDTVLVNWLIDQTLINPILAKQPNVNSVVEGTSVSASISTTGSQGVGCSDILEFRIRTGAVFSAWTNYIENDFIPTSTYDEIQIRGFRGSCISGDNCPPADTAIYSWMIIQGPQEPTIVRNPNNDVCFGETLYATITPNGGGSSCSEYAQYRTYTGGSWSTWAAYTSGSSIGYPINTTQVEVRAWRGNCDPSSGTLSSDTVIVSWNLIELLTNPTLQKNPNIDTVCANSSVYASILASGTGGFGCSDNLQYRVHNGVSYSVWESYLEGDPINSSSYTEIQIRGIHGMCISGNECPPQDTMIYSWVVIPGPIAPIITKNPNQANVCFGVPLSATITPGSGGDGCSDTYQYRTYNGTWTAWTAYVSNNTISYSAGTTQVQIRTFRGDCQVGSGCLSSDTNIVSWQLDPSLINPVLSKNPNISSICAGVQVSASIAVSGSGGIGCSDILQYRINDGVNYSAWAIYNEGDGIATNGLTEVQIRGFYGGCISGDECPAQDTLIYIWTITPGPIAPAITRIPSLDNVCRGTSLSASITPGSGGDGCTDSYESRTFNGVWSAWSNYVPSSNINYGTSTQVEIRAYRTDCGPASGCTSSDTVSAIWYIIDNLVNPILTKTPDLTIVCEGTDVSALISTPGSGGEGCNDQLQYRINTGSGFSAWTFYASGDFINTVSVDEVQIRGFRTNCTSGNQCPPADTVIYSWITSPQPSAPIITRQPNQDLVCRGTTISAEIISGTGGSDCNETYQYRLFDGSWSTWTNYASTTNISYGASVSEIEVRAFRGDCNPSSGCTSSDTNIVSWTIINSLTNPILTKNPDVSSVCSGIVVSASIQTSGSGGIGCSDILQYRIDFGSGYSAWNFYAENDPIPTTGSVTSVQVRGFIGACSSGDECPPMDTTIYTWSVLPGPIAPTITRNPDIDEVCQGEPIAANIIPGYGGDDCNETYQYRTYNGVIWSSWTAYSTGNNISYPIGSEQVEVRAYRADCNPLSGCESSDTSVVSWSIIELLTNPILEQVPSVTTLCQGADVSGIISISGTGGVGCSDILQYRINDGTYSVWANYVAGDLIPTFGINQVQIRGYRGNCLSGGNCAPTDTLVYEWNFVPQPTVPSIVRNPNLSDICEGTIISATITAGTNGVSCIDTYEYRLFDGTWNSWSSYVSGNNINYVNATEVEVRAYRGGCSGGSACQNSDTAIVHWNITPQPIAPTIECYQTATFNTLTCVWDITGTQPIEPATECYETATWNPTTCVWDVTGTQPVEPVTQCYQTATWNPVTCIWDVTGTQPVEPTTECYETATWNPTTCVWDVTGNQPVEPVTQCYQTATWNPVTCIWDVTGTQPIEPTTECYETATWNPTTCVWDVTGTQPIEPIIECYQTSTWNSVTCVWDINGTLPIAPILTKLPDFITICENEPVSAIVNTIGSGGINCSDIIEYRTHNGTSWSAFANYNPGDAISSSGLTQIEIISYRGNCNGNSGCNPTTVDTIHWVVTAKPTAPIITKTPDVANLCEGTVVSAIITNGTGGEACSDFAEYRTFDGSWSAWTAYTSGSSITSMNFTEIQIKAWRGNCSVIGDCSTSDTTYVNWNILPEPVSPVLSKSPNLATLCQGALVSANIVSAGSGGVNCSDIFEYRTNDGSGYSLWQTYIPGDAIPSIGLSNIQIIAYRGNCEIGSMCDQTVADTLNWEIVPQPSAPTITKNPNDDVICYGVFARAIITQGTGGVSCQNRSQYRFFDGTSWTNWLPYASNGIIPYLANTTQIEVRAWRANCTAGSGCLSSDTSIVSWNIGTLPINAVLDKIPNDNFVCETDPISALINISGSGGSGCTDEFNYRTNDGSGYSAWLPYIIGTNIPVLGLTEIQIISSRENCNPDFTCGSVIPDTVHWIVLPQPTNPVIVKIPAENEVCSGTVLSANITPGTLGSSCLNINQYRLFNGTTWSSWTAYTSGANIPFATNTTNVEVRAWRGNCDGPSACQTSDTVAESWIVVPDAIAPVLAKQPNLDELCDGALVSASLVSPGNGGVGCSDLYEYRTNNGTAWTAWSSYIIDDVINTSGSTQIEIRSWRGNCSSSTCSSTDTTVLHWQIISQPLAPILTKLPNENDVCEGTLVSANIAGGTGGTGCSNIMEYRTNNGSWSSWLGYIDGNTMNTIGLDNVEIRAFRVCPAETFCANTDTSLASWNVIGGIIMPVMTKNPNVAEVCDGMNVSASLLTVGFGGDSCSDIFEHSINNGATWIPYTPDNLISTNGLSNVRIRFYRGGCADALLCGSSPSEFIWNVQPAPISPTITKNPNVNNLCEGTPVSAIITAGTGGIDCIDYYQYRTFDGTSWSTWINYNSGNNINTASQETIEIRAFRGDCNVVSGCESNDTAFVMWNIYPQPVAPILAKTPSLQTICQGDPVQGNLINAGTGGAGCDDVFEYRLFDGANYTSWTSYIPGNDIPSIGVAQIQLISYRGNCDAGSTCLSTIPDTLIWDVVPQPLPPIITKNLDVDDICYGTFVRAIIAPGSGGVGCQNRTQLRLFDGTSWTMWLPYSSNGIIPYLANTTQIEVRAWRGLCTSGSGCLPTDTAVVSWNVWPIAEHPIISKYPNVDEACEGVNVGANLLTPGNGGANCNDEFFYRTDDGSGYSAWLPYVLGTDISSLGINTIQIFGVRGNCIGNLDCSISEPDTLTWSIMPQPISPQIIRIPDQDIICQGVNASANITLGTGGGSSCADIYEYRTNDGSIWTAWLPYTNLQNISTIGISSVEIRAFRDCNPINGCESTDTVMVAWNIATDITMPQMTKVPDVSEVCQGYDVQADLISAGFGGGASCEDIFEYRTHNGTSWTTWMTYVPSTSIPTTDLDTVQIHFYRGNCPEANVCGTNAINTYTWVILDQLTPPITTRIPDQDAVCEGALLTAVASGSTGGNGIINYEYENLNPGSWTWNNGNSFIPSSNGMAYIRTRGVSTVLGCENTDWEWVSWIVDPSPEITVSGNANICEGGIAHLNAVVNSGFGAANIQWQYSHVGCTGPWTDADTLLPNSSIYTPLNLTQTTYYRAIGAQANSECQTISECITIHVNPAPLVTIVGDNVACTSSNITIIADVQNASTPITYIWQQANDSNGPWFTTGLDNDTLNLTSITTPKWYRVIVLNDASGCSDTSNVHQIQLGDIPQINTIYGNTEICINENTILTLDVVSNPTATNQWYGPTGIIVGSTSDTLQLNNLQLADEGNYYAIATNICGNINSDTLFIDVLDNMTHPTLISGTNHRCQGEGYDLYTHDGVDVQATNWTLSPPEAGLIDASSGFVTWDATYNGIATISNEAYGCSDTSVAINYLVTVDPSVETPIISGNNIRCIGAGTDTYTATAISATKYHWSISNAGFSSIDTNGVVTWNPAFSGMATIYVYAEGCNGPSEYAHFNVYSYDTIFYSHSGNMNVCVGNEAIAWISPVPPVGNTYQWYDNQGEIAGANDTTIVISNVQLGDDNQYYCRIISFCGDTLFTQADSLNISPTPQAAYIGDGICLFEEITFQNTSSVDEGSLGFIWDFGDGQSSTDENPTHTYLVADTVTVSLTAISEWGCENTISTQFIIHELPTADAITVSDSCNGSGQGSLTLVPINGSAPFTYILNNGTPQTENYFGNLTAGNYTIEIIDSNGCRNSIYAQITQPHIIFTHIYPQDALCFADSSAMAVLEIVGGTLPYNIVWSNGDMTNNLTNVPAGFYTVEITDENGCIASDSVYLTQPNPMFIDSTLIAPSCIERNDGKIYIEVSGGTGDYDYLWSTNTTNDSIVDVPAGIYYLTVTDGHGCTQIKRYELPMPAENCLTIWTSFSPDGDGINDIWNIGNIDLYPDCKVEIFNRWGYKVFESKGYSDPWNGKWNNKDLPAETYYFAITLGDGSKPITGSVTIIR